jgi:Domain of unknown function (DUF4126)
VDPLATLATALGSAWLSGVNLYATVMTLGLLQRFGLADLPGELGALAEWWVIALAGALYLIEFLADKIPGVDSVWNAVHTFIRVPAGAILAAAAFADFPPSVRIAALLIGGGVALGAHGSKAATRVAVNTMSMPGANIVLSLAEDVVAFGAAVLMVFHPFVVLCLVIAALAVTAFVIRKVARALWRTIRPIARRRTPTRALRPDGK